MNVAIRKSLDEFNSRKMAGRNKSRKELFLEMEKEFLQPLPALRYQMRERKSATVMRNSYVTLNKHHYSVPVEYI
ncbi:Mu transposase domain-containing protein, partial [Klebsiella pneumoniae]|uniref:Mu transposase domain-containing protein n=1 Tax=Klebsiella pneumoniae TaxID=573 RepID=UPI003F74DE99